MTAKGMRAYTFTARSKKYFYGKDLNRLRMSLTRELERIGILDNRAEYDKQKRAKKLEQYRAKCREYYYKNREAINEKRRKG